MSQQRNNEERLGSPATPTDPSPSILAGQSLNFPSPTEWVTLPSKGLYYPEGHPLHNVEEIEIRYMQAKDEDILTSQVLIKKGIAIERLVQNVIVDKSISIDDLLIGDKNAIVLATRITGFGSDYNVNITCPSCGESSEHTFDLSAIVPNEPLEELPEGVEKTDRNTFFIKLPKMGLRVEVKLLIGKDEKSLQFMKEKKKKHKLPDSNSTDMLRLFVIGVEGHSESNVVEQLIANMAAIDSRYLKKMYKKIVPNIDLKKEVICEACSKGHEVEMPFTTSFFWSEP